MKVLLAPHGSRGDVQPQLVLGAELLRRGHAVTLAAPPNFRSSVEARGLRFIPVGEDMNAVLLGNRHMTQQNPLVALPGQIRLLRRHLRQQVADLLAVPHDADVVVAAGVSFAAKMVADSLNVPHVFCCYTLSGVRSAAHPPAVMPLFGLPRLANRALWSFIEATFEATLGGVLNGLRRDHGLPSHRSSWRSIHATQVMLAQDAIMGELPSDAPGNNVHLPALVPRARDVAPLPDLLERFLRGASAGSSAGSPVVYLGFGSMPSVDRAQIVRIACELFEKHAARVILHSSHDEEAGVELPPGVLSVGSVDHPALFPRVDLIVHHGGAGTTAAALRSGVAQLVVPHIVDQFFHGRRVAELGLGPAPIPKAQLTADAIARALKDRFKYWAAAQRVRASVDADGGAKAAADHLEMLVNRGTAGPFG